ncbi:MAG: universal stress protein [Planctomycetes bacterium]|nr:universal stress protein [Planctomycetota bacterium]
MPYRNIMLCVDNSAHSNHAAQQAARLARAFDAKVTGVHVYAAGLHYRRFTDLEPTLPKEYQEPKKIEAMRDTHDSLIIEGLKLISNSYMDAARKAMDGVPLEVKNVDGSNYVELVRESKNGYDLAVIGARGLGLASTNGQCPSDALGTVCERFVRRVRTEVLIVKDARPMRGTILVSVDGSPESYAALRKAINLAKAVGARVEAVTCFDPNFHPVVFKAIVQILSQKDKEAFNFEGQEKLHDRVIHQGLEAHYRGYLEKARMVAQAKGLEIETCLLMGRPAFEVVGRAKQTEARLIVLSRFGRHRTEESDIGSVAEAVVRLAPCNVLIVNDAPEQEPAAPGLEWTPEALEKLERVPGFVKPMVKQAVESYAKSHGFQQVTPAVVDDAKANHGVHLPGHGIG